MTSKHLQCVLAAVGIIFLAAGSALFAAPLRNHPITITQPDGVILHCFVSGDEYFNWIHDKDGYTIIQDSSTGFYTYAIASFGLPMPSRYIVGQADPATLGLEKHVLPAADRMPALTAAFPGGSPRNPDQIVNAPRKGTINNLVVFIRFSDESEFGRQTGPYDAMFNSNSSGANSVYNYYQEVSYNQLSINSFFYPTPSGGYVVSYQDSHPRGYYKPYTSTNTIGYTGETESTNREHTLLANAVNAIASQVPSSLALDADGDGRVDSVCFIVRGQPTGWDSLLWPHMWSLYSQTANINGKRVYTYDFQVETSLDSDGVGVLCHEMFHTLGAPDLYHYSFDNREPVYRWDLMEDDLNPPQHMGAYMKMRYGKWISSIPVISTAGTYNLNPLTSSTNNAYRIDSPNSLKEYFIVEFRKKTGTFETSLPGEGILVYRINTNLDGQGNENGPPDEVYIYRPNGTKSLNGSPASANFSAKVGRTSINDSTNPSSFLSDGSAGGLNITGISSVGSTMSFCLQSCSTGSTPQAQVTSLSSVSGATTGGTAALSAEVMNTVSVTLPSNAAVWFYVSGAGISNNWVGFASVSGLAPGAKQWFSFSWNIPSNLAGGTYTYSARVYTDQTAISEGSSTQTFSISPAATTSAQVLSLYSVSNAVIGSNCTLWAQVKNTGGVALPSNAAVWFYVEASGISNNWVGFASAAGLAVGATQWFSINWSIPAGVVPGTGTYYARVYTDSTAISDRSVGQNFTISGSVSAQVVSLYDVKSAVVGGGCTLWAQIRNTGSTVLPSTALVWFYVEVGGLSSPWVGSASVAGLAVGATQWFSHAWTIPGSVSPGAATYYARVYTDGTTIISDWSAGQSFTIGGGATISAQILSLYPVGGATIGGLATLWAQVKNTGASALPSDAALWFYVDGGNIANHWVGYASVAGLPVGSTTWYSYSWLIPSNLPPGTYTYWAQAYTGSKSISDWSAGQSFTLSK